MKLQIKAGTTSKRLGIFIQANNVTTGAGLTGLVFNTASLSWYYWREDEGNANATAVTLATATRGTFASGGFIEKDATNMPGFYEIGIPNAALAAGATWVNMVLKGAANMAPLTLEIELVAYDPQAATNLGLSALPTANPGAANGVLIAGTNAPVTITGAGTALTLLSASGNGHGLRVEGNGSGEGLSAQGGATGTGIEATGGATSGAGISGIAQGASAEGITGLGGGTDGEGIVGYGTGSGAGIVGRGGATGHGVFGFGGATSGDGAHFEAQTEGDGLDTVGAGTGVDIRGAITGNITGSITTAVNVTTVNGLAAGVITATSIAANAFASAKFAADYFTDTGVAVWASATRTLTSFGTLVADVVTAVWGAATRILTAGTNIVLAKGTGVTGFNDLSQADVRTAVGLASANLDTQLGDLPTNAEFNARTLVAASYGTAANQATIIANQTTINNNVLTRATPAEVNAEVVDALSVDTYAAPTGVPPSTDTIANKIGRLHKVLRNRIEVDSGTGEKRFYNDANAAEWKKGVTDDGTTYEESVGGAP